MKELITEPMRVNAMSKKYLGFDCIEEIKQKTDKAVLLIFPDGEEVWLPLSQINIDYIYHEETNSREIFFLEIPEWLAIEKEIEMYAIEE